MSGKSKYFRDEIDINRLNFMYLNREVQLYNIARTFGCSTRTITDMISKQRALNPEKWPLRYKRA